MRVYTGDLRAVADAMDAARLYGQGNVLESSNLETRRITGEKRRGDFAGTRRRANPTCRTSGL
jgi:hypothetical protein